MGAKQRAQKRGKATPKAAKGSLKGSPASQKKGNSSLYVPSLDPRSRSSALLGWQDFAQSSPPNVQHGFSMSEEARNTERHLFGWGATKLRGNAISFVSAGHLHQDEMKDPTNRDEGIATDPGATAAEPHAPPAAEGSVEESTIDTAQDEDNVVSDDRPGMPQDDLSADAIALRADFGPPRERSPSSSSSESEQIVFVGRSKGSRSGTVASSRLPSTSRKALAGISSELPPATEDHRVSATQPLPIRKSEPLGSRFDASSSERRLNKGRYRRRGRRRPQEVSDEEEAIMQDYIANMAMDDTEGSDEKTSKPVRKNEHFRFYDGAGEEHMKVQIQPSVQTNSQAVLDARDLDQAVDWNSDDLEIFDTISTSEEEVAEIEQVLRHRERPSGTQYLVTPRGSTTNDAKWILEANLTSESALHEIQIFQEIQAMEFEEDTFDENDESPGTSEDEALNDLVDNIESEDDENARILAHTSMMTDEQIAQALAKQEELGLGGDELMLFSGNVRHDDDALDGFENGDDFISFSTKQHTSNRTRSKRNKKQRDSFPSAAAFADALDEDPYGGFDVMDFDRPSLRPRKKGRKSDFPYDLELEDEDLKDQLVSTWMKDREKKAQRKRDKEEARQAALFDASERGDPAVIKAEIRRFLCQEIEVLRLAPMEPHVRASVHRLAKALRLNSHSEGKDGKGGGRYPVLTKTVRTPSYSIDSIWEVDALMNTRKFFPKSTGGFKSKTTARASITRTQRSGGVQGASYMNGEVVGASAPEIGSDNKGRAMLEKMGWTSGMAIGAEGNKGSLEAIKHVFKTTKAGLG